jgi:hypothetical protein
MTLVAGDRVELASLNCSGRVEHVDDEHVRVRWDDGKIGLLYWEPGMIPNAHHLLGLAAKLGGEG